MKKLFEGWTKEQIQEWLESKGEPEGCSFCGAIAGTCIDYPSCPAGKKEDTKNASPSST